MRGEYFWQFRPLHEDDAVFVPGGKRKQEPRYHFHNFALHLSRCAAWIVGQLLDPFPLQVAAGIVSVRRSFAVGKRRHATGNEHLHHE